MVPEVNPGTPAEAGPVPGLGSRIDEPLVVNRYDRDLHATLCAHFGLAKGHRTGVWFAIDRDGVRAHCTDAPIGRLNWGDDTPLIY